MTNPQITQITEDNKIEIICVHLPFIIISRLYISIREEYTMNKSITRRHAIAAGAAATGLPFLRPRSSIAQQFLGNSGNPPFLSPWSPSPDFKRDLTPGNTPIRLAAWNTGTTTLEYPQNGDIRGKVKRIRDHGYSSANCHPGRLRRNPWLDATETEIRELKAALKEFDVTFFDMHANANNMHPDPEERHKEQQWTFWQMESAERVGCPLVSTHVGSMAPSAIAPHPDNWTWETWRLSVNTMKQMIRDTEGMDVAFAIEPDPLVQINNNTAMKQLMEECGPRVKVCYDPVNMMDLSIYYRTGEFINESFDMFADDILCAHAKDSLVLPDKMSAYITEVPAGQGVLDYETYLVRLSRLPRTITLLIEHIDSDEYPAAREFIVSTAKRLGVKIYGEA